LLPALPAPVIITQPQSQTIQGAALKMSVIAQGAGPLSYRWLFNGAPNLLPSSGTWTAANPPTTLTGDYQAIVSNPYGSVTSIVAHVVVLSSAIVQKSPSFNKNGGFSYIIQFVNGQAFTSSDTNILHAQWTTNLSNWVELTNGINFSNGVVRVLDPSAVTRPFSFYRDYLTLP
jgi:hypothetical protein